MQKITIDDLVSFDDIKKCIEDFCMEFDIQDMSKETQNRYDGCMMYLYNNLFCKRKYTYFDDKMKRYILPVVDLYCDLYIYTCSVYNKVPGVLGLQYMLHIDDSIIYRWSEKNLYFYKIDLQYIDPMDILKDVYDDTIYNINDIVVSDILDNSDSINGGCNSDKLVRCKADTIRKKLVQANENGLTGLLSSGKNPVGIIAILNHVHRWSDSGGAPIQENKPELVARKNVFSLPKND